MLSRFLYIRCIVYLHRSCHHLYFFCLYREDSCYFRHHVLQLCQSCHPVLCHRPSDIRCHFLPGSFHQRYYLPIFCCCHFQWCCHFAQLIWRFLYRLILPEYFYSCCSHYKNVRPDHLYIQNSRYIPSPCFPLCLDDCHPNSQCC